MNRAQTGGAEQELIEQLQARVAELEVINKTQAEQIHAQRDVGEWQKEKIERLESDLAGCIKLIAKYEAER